METTKKSIGYIQFFKVYPDFKYLWKADLLSLMGDWFKTIAVYTLIHKTTSSSVAIALVLFFQTLPTCLITPIIGPIIDRVDRRKLLLIANASRIVSVSIIIVVSYYDNLVLLYIMTGAISLATGIQMSTKTAVIPMLIPKKDIAVADALSAGTWSIMLAVGASLGGLVVASMGVAAALIINLGLYIVSSIFLMKLPPLIPRVVLNKAETKFIECVRYLKTRSYIFFSMLIKPVAMAANVTVVLIPIYGELVVVDAHIVHLVKVVLIPIDGTHVFEDVSGAYYTGLLFGTRGLGSMVGSLGMRMLVGDRLIVLRYMVCCGFLGMCLGLIWLSFAQNFTQVMGSYFFIAIFSSIIWVFSSSLLHREADRDYHGRIFATEFGLVTLLIALGGLMAGYCLDLGSTLAQVVTVCSGIAFLGGCGWFVVMIRELRRYKGRRIRFG